MTVALDTLIGFCDRELASERFKDYCPNGLQVEGRPSVQRIAAAVTANQAVLDEAVDWGADVLLVHHGYFWRGEDAVITGMKRRRLATLLRADMSLVAYHLPLDAHPVLGNNAQLGLRLGVSKQQALDASDPQSVGNLGVFDEPLSLAALLEKLYSITLRKPLLIGDETRIVSRVAWCTGAAQGYIDKAAACGADVYISGEISEPTVHAARELGIAYIAAGHHATERYGVQALAKCLAEQFDVEWRFIDCDNPV